MLWCSDLFLERASEKLQNRNSRFEERDVQKCPRNSDMNDELSGAKPGVTSFLVKNILFLSKFVYESSFGRKAKL